MPFKVYTSRDDLLIHSAAQWCCQEFMQLFMLVTPAFADGDVKRVPQQLLLQTVQSMLQH
jgi:hypothetical protein